MDDLISIWMLIHVLYISTLNHSWGSHVVDAAIGVTVGADGIFELNQHECTDSTSCWLADIIHKCVMSFLCNQ
jgi:hypothetical protein